MINLSYHGNKDSENWIAFIGKGVCFDTGGYNIKNTAHIVPMFLDKHGACSCLSAFESLVRSKPKLNLTVTVGMV
jgi:leucyl aminopeptidase